MNTENIMDIMDIMDTTNAGTEKERESRALKILQMFNSGVYNTEYILRLLGIKGDLQTAIIKPQFHVEFGNNITLGKNFNASVGLTILDNSEVIIGDNVQCGPRVTITTATHPLLPRARRNNDVISKPIKIGNDVWIGAGAIIMPGVTIGNNIVIGAGAVITEDIPDGYIVTGVPAKVIMECEE